MAPAVPGIVNANTTNHHRPEPHIALLPNEIISVLTPYSGLIITVWMVILFLIRHYLLEGYLFRRMYGHMYEQMDDGLKRGFMNHHIAGGVKIVLLIAGAKPWLAVLFGKANLHTPLGHHPHPTMGDMLLVLTQLFVAMYLFELFYRKTLSPVAVLHHVGAVTIAQAAVVLSLDLSHEADATIEFVLCLVWGAFDVLAELWLNIAFILYRVFADSHSFLTYLFFGTFLITTMGTIAETIMVFILFGESWSRWELSFKIVTPILHVVFTAAQLHGSRILLCMWRKEKRKLAQEEGELHDIETDPRGDTFQSRKKKEAVADEEIAVVMQASTTLSDSDTIHAESSTQSTEEKIGGGRQCNARGKLRKALRFLRPIGHYITGR